MVYTEIQKGGYGLKQAGILVNIELTCHLETHGYKPVQYTPGLWNHKERYILVPFILAVFHIWTQKQCEPSNSSSAGKIHPIQGLGGKIALWTHTRVELQKNTSDLSMPGYVKAAINSY